MTASKTMYLIYSPHVEEQLHRVTSHPLISENNIELSLIKLTDLASLHRHDDLNHALLWIQQQDYPKALLLAKHHQLSLGFLPIAGDTLNQFYINLDLPTDLTASLEIAIHPDPLEIDIIIGNGEAITNGINLENQTMMSEFIGDDKTHGIKKFKFNCKRFMHAFSLVPHPVTLITAKGKSISTAITGMVLLDFHKSGYLTQLFTDSVSLRDKRVSVALFAPHSILSYLRLSSSLLMPSQKKNLPQQCGYIRTASLTVRSPVDTHFLVNNKPLTTRELSIETLPQGIKVNAGKKFRERQHYTDDKENVICEQLPQQEDRIKYLAQSLPFFSHALESDFKDLFLALKASANVNNTYVLLMILSSLLATLGLFLNSPSIVIGAMILAPLMAPIISLSMGLLRSDADLSRRAFATLVFGMLIALSLSALIAYILPFQQITNEIAGRLHPSTLDLLVAVISGVAGALVNSRENIAKSLPGVAIAVALVPPLCVSGIGLGWMDLDVFYGAMLLFLTNLTGIILAAGLSFMVIGFAPFSRARKGIFISILLVGVISIPLFLAFSNMQKIAAIEKQLHKQTYQLAGATQQLRNIKVNLTTPMQVTGEIISTSIPDPKLMRLLEQQLSTQLKKPIKLNLAVHWVSENYFDTERH